MFTERVTKKVSPKSVNLNVTEKRVSSKADLIEISSFETHVGLIEFVVLSII